MKKLVHAAFIIFFLVNFKVTWISAQSSNFTITIGAKGGAFLGKENQDIDLPFESRVPLFLNVEWISDHTISGGIQYSKGHPFGKNQHELGLILHIIKYQGKFQRYSLIDAQFGTHWLEGINRGTYLSSKFNLLNLQGKKFLISGRVGTLVYIFNSKGASYIDRAIPMLTAELGIVFKV